MRTVRFAVEVAPVGALLAGYSGEQRASSLKAGDCLRDLWEMCSGEEIVKVFGLVQ